MRKIFGYECRRLLGSKIFWGLSAVTLWFAQQLLRGVILWGVANTAPFSPWSFGYYLASLLPFLCMVELFFLSFFTSGAERSAAVLTAATPVDPRRYLLVRLSTVGLGTALLTLGVTALGIGFYLRLFGMVPLEGLALAALLVLLPALLFVLGLGWTLGQLHPALVYGLMAVCFLLPYLPLPAWLSPVSTAFFTQYPAWLGVLDPPFSLSPAFWVSRLLFALAGLALLGCTAFRHCQGHGNCHTLWPAGTR